MDGRQKSSAVCPFQRKKNYSFLLPFVLRDTAVGRVCRGNLVVRQGVGEGWLMCTISSCSSYTFDPIRVCT